MARRLDVDVDGSGDAHLDRLRACDAKVVANGSGSVDVRAEQRLDVDVDVDGFGDVEYHGDPALTKTVDGSSELSQAD